MKGFKNLFYTSSLSGFAFHTMQYHLKKELKNCSSVLDLGCGSGSPLQYCKIKYSLGIDIFKPYLNISKKQKIHNKYQLADITKLYFKSKTFDAVILINVLEHLKKNRALDYLNK